MELPLTHEQLILHLPVRHPVLARSSLETTMSSVLSAISTAASAPNYLALTPAFWIWPAKNAYSRLWCFWYAGLIRRKKWTTPDHND
jgi:hypothetical protein